MTLRKYSIFKPRNYKQEFVAPFEAMFDQIMNDLYPTLYKELDKDFFQKGSYPKCNIYKDSDNLTIEAAVPGLKKGELDIQVSNNILTISGKSTNIKDKKETYLHREIKKSSFQRSFNLSDELDVSAIKATHDHGILCIEIPYLKPKEKEEQSTVKVKIV